MSLIVKNTERMATVYAWLYTIFIESRTESARDIVEILTHRVVVPSIVLIAIIGFQVRDGPGCWPDLNLIQNLWNELNIEYRMSILKK